MQVDDKCVWRLGRIGDVIYAAFMSAQIQQRTMQTISDEAQRKHDEHNIHQWAAAPRQENIIATHRTNAFETGTWQVTGSLYNSSMQVMEETDVNINDMHHAWDSVDYWDTEKYGEEPLIGCGADTDEEEWSSTN